MALHMQFSFTGQYSVVPLPAVCKSLSLSNVATAIYESPVTFFLNNLPRKGCDVDTGPPGGVDNESGQDFYIISKF
jgi:hypothetical protein